MTSYNVVFLMIGFAAFIAQPTKRLANGKVFAIIAFALLCSLSAFRGDSVGNDTIRYWNAFPLIGSTPWESYESFRYEPGFFAFCKLLTYLTVDSRLLIFVSSIVCFSIIGYFYYKYSEDIVITVILFIALMLFPFFLSGMRQSLAIVIVLMGLHLYLKYRRIFIYILMILIAASFHTSAIACLIILPLLSVKFNNKTLLIIAIIALIGFIFADQIKDVVSFVFGRYTSYDESYHGGSNYFGALFKTLFYVLLFVVAYMYIIKNINNDENAMVLNRNILSLDFLLLMASIGIIFCVIGMRIEIFGRMANYFIIFFPLLLPAAFKRIENRKERTLIRITALLISCLYFVVIMTFRPEWLGIIPYVSYF